MSINSTNSTNLLLKYQSLKADSGTPNVEKKQSQDKKDELILKQKELIKLQKDEIQKIKNSSKNKESGFLNSILAIIGTFTVVNWIFNAIFLKKYQGENATPDIQKWFNQLIKSIDEDDIIQTIQPAKKSKRITKAIFNHSGKVIGESVTDRATGQIIKNTEFYPGTKNTMTEEFFDYKKNLRVYSWFTEDGKKMWEEFFNLKTGKKIKVNMYENDGITVKKTNLPS